MIEQKFVYAGFWKRFLAYLIDEILLGAVLSFLFIPFSILIGLVVFSAIALDEYDYSSMVNFIQQEFDDVSLQEILMIVIFIVIFAVFAVILQWLYYSLMESSSKQGTVGKMVLNLKVVDLVGNKISFGRATGRFFGKFLSGLLLNIGYIMAAFTERKQALHDMLAGCLVIYDDPLQNLFKEYEQPGDKNEIIS
jgi:uncharacterized RDD family membrane protein YckC